MACLSIKSCSDDNKEAVVVSPPAPIRPVCGSLTPYLFIQNIAPEAYLHFQQKSLLQVSQPIDKPDDFATSCSYNAIALMVMFSGIDKAKRIYKRLMISGCRPFILASGDQSPEYRLKVDDLFTSQCIAIFEMPIEQEIPKALFKQKMDECGVELLQSLQPALKGCFKDESGNLETSLKKVKPKIHSLMQAVDFSFNKAAIDLILLDFDRNGLDLSNRTSFVYYFVIGGGELGLYHAFCVEQFFVPKEPKGLFRIYQSWHHQMTLLKYFERRGYGAGIQGCLNYEEISKLFRDIDLIFLNRNRKDAPPEEELSKIHQRCFDVASPSPFVPVYFLPKKRTLGGLSLRYVCDKIRPSDCVDHFHEFMSQ